MLFAVLRATDTTNLLRKPGQIRRALVVVISALVILGTWMSSSRASDLDVRFSVVQALETEAFQDLALGSVNVSQTAATRSDSEITPASYSARETGASSGHGMSTTRVGYDGGFVIASLRQQHLNGGDTPFLMKINGWGQLRHTNLNSQGPNQNVNQFQLKRGRLVFSGHAFTPDFAYFVQLDGRSSSGDDVRLLDYFLTYDVGHHGLGLERNELQFKTGTYKMPFTMARYLSGREFEFSDRSVASTYFDVNRSLAWGLYGERNDWNISWDWELAVFNGLVTGGAETGSSGALDNNFAYSGRFFIYPTGEWRIGELADFEWHEKLATRAGMAFANSTIESDGATEFNRVCIVDSGATLASLFPPLPVSQYTVNLYSVDASLQWRGWSTTLEYYFRHIDQVDDAAVDSLFDHGFWFQIGKFVVPSKLHLLTRWSRVVGDSGTLGLQNQSAEEIAGGAAWYLRDQHVGAISLMVPVSIN